MNHLKFAFLCIISVLISCSGNRDGENETSGRVISVTGIVMDNFTNKPISNLKMYVYKPSSLYQSGGIVAETVTDQKGIYSMTFKRELSDYYVSFNKSGGSYVYDANNFEHHLDSGNNYISFNIRKAKVFKTIIDISNNTYGSMTLYNGYFTESQTIPFGVTNVTKYFLADPLGPNIFQMYVHEADGHYWWKLDVKEFTGVKDTLTIHIDADLKTFKRYAQNENPGT